MESEAVNSFANGDQSRIENRKLVDYNFFTRNLIAVLLVFVVFSSYRNLLSLAGEEKQLTPQESFPCKPRLLPDYAALLQLTEEKMRMSSAGNAKHDWVTAGVLDGEDLC